jgi:hypothetical protein
MPARRVILAERRAANDNFVERDHACRQRGFGALYSCAKGARLKGVRTLVRVIMTASFSLLLLVVICAAFLLGLVLVGLFAAGLAVSRLIRRHIPALAFPIYRVGPRAPG